jgi:hypothetical protein
VLVPLEGVLDSPPLLTQVTEHRRRVLFGIDVCGGQAGLTFGRDLARQAQRGCSNWAIPIARVVSAWRARRHRAGQRARVTKGFGGAPAAVVAAAHDGADAAGAKQAHQLGRRIAASEHQHVVETELVGRFHKHAALARAGMHGQRRPRQVQHKQAVIGCGRRALKMTTPVGLHQYRRRPGYHAQPAPASDQAGLIGTANHEIVERVQRRQTQVLTRLGESTVRDLSNLVETAADRGEEAVEHRLLRLFAHRHQCTDQRRRQQLAFVCERLEVVSVLRTIYTNSSEEIRAVSSSVKYYMN